MGDTSDESPRAEHVKAAPSFQFMLLEAIRCCEDSGHGPASFVFIKNYMFDTYRVEPTKSKIYLKKAVEKAFSDNLIERPKRSEVQGPSLTGKFQLVKKKPEKKSKEPKESKAPKESKEPKGTKVKETKQKPKAAKATDGGATNEKKAPRKRKKQPQGGVTGSETEEEVTSPPKKSKKHPAAPNKRTKSPLGAPPAPVKEIRLSSAEATPPPAAEKQPTPKPSRKKTPATKKKSAAAVKAPGEAGSTPARAPKVPASVTQRRRSRGGSVALLASKRKGSHPRTPAATRTRARGGRAAPPALPRKPRATKPTKKTATKSTPPQGGTEETEY